MKVSAQFILLICLLILRIPVYAQTSGAPGSSPALTNNGVTLASLAACLPADIKLGDVVSATSDEYANGRPTGLRKVTVEQTLRELEATCDSEKKLVDGKGKQIVFYRLTGCWGNPPVGYEDILRRQQEEIAKLKEQYAVIEITCNPSGAPIS